MLTFIVYFDLVCYWCVSRDSLCVCVACHILECSDGLAQDVISTIGQAFDLRFQLYLQCPSSKPSSMPDRRVSTQHQYWSPLFSLSTYGHIDELWSFDINLVNSSCGSPVGSWAQMNLCGLKKGRSPPIIIITTAFPARCHHQGASSMLDCPIRHKTTARCPPPWPCADYHTRRLIIHTVISCILFLY